jgi:hypothetical protein
MVKATSVELVVFIAILVLGVFLLAKLIVWFASPRVSPSGSPVIDPAQIQRAERIFLRILPAVALILMSLFVMTLFQTQVLDWMDLWSQSLKYAVWTVVILLAIIAVLIKDQFWFRQGIIVMGLALMFFVPLTARGLETAINNVLDRSPASMHIEPVIDKFSTPGRGASYHVLVHSWRSGHQAEDLQVGRSFYDQLSPKDTILIIKSKPGRLHYEWVVSYAIAPK